MELSITVPDNMEDLKKTLTVAVDPSSKNVTVKGNCPTKDKEPEVWMNLSYCYHHKINLGLNSVLREGVRQIVQSLFVSISS